MNGVQTHNLSGGADFGPYSSQSFKQLYTIRVPFKDVTGTAVYAFLPKINVKIPTGNSSSLLFKLPCPQLTFQCPDFEDAVLRAVTAVFGRHINH
jgi:hypothetical protein